MDPHLKKLQTNIAEAISGLDSGQMAKHAPGKWCVGEILEHLYLTYTGTLKGCGRLLAAGKPLASRSSLQKKVRALIVVGFGYMPTGRKSPDRVRPRGLAPEKIAVEIQSKIEEMDVILTQCASKFGTRAKVLDHPILGPFSVDQWRKFHLVHGMHHVKQIRRLKQEMQESGTQAAVLQK